MLIHITLSKSEFCARTFECILLSERSSDKSLCSKALGWICVAYGCMFTCDLKERFATSTVSSSHTRCTYKQRFETIDTVLNTS